MRNEIITPLYERLSYDDELQGESNSMSNQKRTRKVIMWTEVSGRSLKIPTSPSSISRLLTLCRKSAATSGATRTAGAKRLR